MVQDAAGKITLPACLPAYCTQSVLSSSEETSKRPGVCFLNRLAASSYMLQMKRGVKQNSIDSASFGVLRPLPRTSRVQGFVLRPSLVDPHSRFRRTAGAPGRQECFCNNNHHHIL